MELNYELTVDGQIVDKTTETTGPLDYIHGEHMLLPKFEAELEGLEAGSVFAFTLAPEDAYGEYEPKRKFDIPKSSFEINGKLREDLLKIGGIVPLLNSSGMVVRAKIVAVHDDEVTVDFNHPMAGKTLNFSGTVLSVRDATEKELSEGLHGEFLPMEGCCHGGGKGCCHGKGHGDGGHCCHGDGEGCKADGQCCNDGDGGCCNDDCQCGCEDGCGCSEDGVCGCESKEGSDCGCGCHNDGESCGCN